MSTSRSQVRSVFTRQVLAQQRLREGYNVNTEEETISGWIVRGTEKDWLEMEHARWAEGKLKSRYAGRLSDLLSDRSLTFERGWPVVEGNQVLLTAVLQRLMDDLGEPFIRAMRDKLSGEVTFDQAVVIDFDTRQQVLAQGPVVVPSSRGADSVSHLNELFSRIAHGTLPLEQLSPRCESCSAAFSARRAWTMAALPIPGNRCATWPSPPTATALSRYDAIEKAVRQRRSAAFEQAGTRPADGHIDDSRAQGASHVRAADAAPVGRAYRPDQAQRPAGVSHADLAAQRPGA